METFHHLAQTHIHTAGPAQFTVRARRGGERWSPCEHSSFCNIWCYQPLLKHSRSAAAWGIPGQAARVGESSLSAREIPADASWRRLQISRETPDQGTVHKKQELTVGEASTAVAKAANQGS